MSDVNIPHNGLAEDGWTKGDEATATCFCGSVQMVFVSAARGIA